MKILNMLFLLMILLFLTSCFSNYTSLNKEIGIKKGMTFDEIQSLNKNLIFSEKQLEHKYNENPHTFKIKNNTFVVYFKEHGTSYTSSSTRNYSGVGSSTIETMTKYYTNFYYIFNDDKIVWWGYLYELKNEQDKILYELAENIENYYVDHVYED